MKSFQLTVDQASLNEVPAGQLLPGEFFIDKGINSRLFMVLQQEDNAQVTYNLQMADRVAAVPIASQVGGTPLIAANNRDSMVLKVGANDFEFIEN